MILVPVVILAAVGVAILLRPWPFYLTPEESRQYFERNIPAAFAKWVERRARERGLAVRGVARSVQLECKKCGKESNYIIYPDEVCERCWRASLKPVPPQTKAQHP